MKRGAKRNFKVVSFAAVMIIFGHYVDFFNMVMPEPNWVTAGHEEGGHEKEHGEHHGSIVSANNSVLLAEASATETKAEATASDAMPATTTAAPAESEGSHDAGDAHAAEAHAEHAAAHAEHGEEAEVTYAGLGIAELLIFIGFAGLFLYMFFLNLAKRPLVPDSDPYLKESINHHI
jgi:hypothetical protein